MTSIPSVRENAAGSPATKQAILAFFWTRFNTEFPTEEDCLEELYRRAAQEHLLKCRNCGNADILKNYGERVINCRQCKKETWLTAGTFFNRIKHARPWVAAIWLMEHGISLSSSKFQKLVGIAYSSALNIFKKLTTVIQGQMGEDGLVVPSSLFSILFCKRSRETPARAHPIAEERIERKLLDDGVANKLSASEDLAAASSTLVTSIVKFASDPNSLSKAPEATNSDIEETTHAGGLYGSEKEVYDLLSTQPVQFDIICDRTGMPASKVSSALTMLELAGVVIRVAGDRYVRNVSKPSGQKTAVQSSGCTVSTAETTMNVAAVINFVRRNFQGISRKYLQNYLAAYWCTVDKTRWSLGSLLQACLRSDPISYDEILDYVSPPLVKMLPPQ